MADAYKLVNLGHYVEPDILHHNAVSIVGKGSLKAGIKDPLDKILAILMKRMKGIEEGNNNLYFFRAAGYGKYRQIGQCTNNDIGRRFGGMTVAVCIDEKIEKEDFPPEVEIELVCVKF
jgi:hypothetical protein